jgi:hypothetical protein
VNTRECVSDRCIARNMVAMLHLGSFGSTNWQHHIKHRVALQAKIEKALAEQFTDSKKRATA